MHRVGIKWNEAVVRLGLGVSLIPAAFDFAVAYDITPPETTGKIQPDERGPPSAFLDSSAGWSSFGDNWASVNGTVAPFSKLYESGLRLRVSGDASWYKYLLSEDPRLIGSGHSEQGSLLVGYQISLPRVSVVGYIGGTYLQSHNEGVTSDRWGGRAILTTFAKPTDDTMVYNSISYSTVQRTLLAQGKLGYKLPFEVYFGPEAGYSWQDVTTSVKNYGVLRVGAHLSSVKTGPLYWGVSGGWARHHDLGDGYYANINVYVGF